MAGVFRRIFVTALAMGFRLLSQCVCSPTNGQPGEIYLLVFREYLPGGPTKLEPPINCIVVQPSLFRPLNNRECFAFVFYTDVAKAIVGLLFPGRPLAVVGTVVAVIINAINCVAIGARPHVFLER